MKEVLQAVNRVILKGVLWVINIIFLAYSDYKIVTRGSRNNFVR